LSGAQEIDSTGVVDNEKTPVGKLILAVVAACLAMVFLNRTMMFIVQQIVFAQDALRDGSIAMFTLIVPAFCGGLAAGAIAPKSGLTVGFLSGLLLGGVGAVQPLWRSATVSEHSTHSALMHYLTTNPIVTMSFAALGGWFAGQFGTGRFRFDDAAPVRPDESD